MMTISMLRGGVVFSVGSALLAGCMVSPVDGQVLGDASEPVVFLGYHLDEGVNVALEAYNPVSGNYDELTVATATDDVELPSGPPLFAWHESGVVIPAEYWSNESCEGSSAKLRAVDIDSGAQMATVLQDWGACLAEQEYDPGRFFARCRSPRLNEALVVTEGFEEFAPALYMEDIVKRFGNFNALRIHLDHIRGSISALQMRASVDGISEVYDCEYRACLEEWICETPDIGDSAFADSFGDDGAAFNEALRDRGALQFRGRDATACSNGARWTDWSDPQRWYRSGIGTCSGTAPPPEPVPVPAHTTWDVQCLCETAFGVGNVGLDVCMASEAGAAWACEFFENDFEAAYGVPIECALTAYTDTGVGGCHSGSRTVREVETELYE